MEQPNLSYIITTFNKLSYLKIVVNKLLCNVKKDEEIVIVDGGSIDGTVEFLQNLYEKGLIHQYVSEPDSGEGHGFNKAILMAKGKIVKFLTDDDVFNYEAIDACKNYMLSNSNLDFLFTGGGDYQFLESNDINYFTEIYEQWLKEYSANAKPFSFCMLGAMMNKSSLPLLGLLNPSIKRADAEYSLRVTSSKIKIALCPAACFVRILNSNSNSAIFNEKIKVETDKLNSFYDIYLDGQPPIAGELSSTEKFKNILRPVYRSIVRGSTKEIANVQSETFQPFSFENACSYAEKWMSIEWSKSKPTFVDNINI